LVNEARHLLFATIHHSFLPAFPNFLPREVGNGLLVPQSQARTISQILHARRSLHPELNGNLSTLEESFEPLDVLIRIVLEVMPTGSC
jgi:hypothetical protein